ncbi:MAG: hypothetical protein AB7F65_03990 [Dehalococcoidia bacterium]
MIPTLVVLFVLYVLLTSWQMRRALATKEPEARFREAKRLLWSTTLGVPLLIAFIFAM